MFVTSIASHWRLSTFADLCSKAIAAEILKHVGVNNHVSLSMFNGNSRDNTEACMPRLVTANCK